MRIGRKRLRQEARWRKIDAQVWWTLTIELRFQWVDAKTLAGARDLPAHKVVASLQRLEQAGHVRAQWKPERQVREYQAVWPIAEESDPAKITFHGAY